MESSLLNPPDDCGTRLRSWWTYVKSTGVVTLAFCGMVVIQVLILLFKEASQSDDGYGYNPASAIAMAEFGKLCISGTMWVMTRESAPLLPDVPKELP